MAFPVLIQDRAVMAAVWVGESFLASSMEALEDACRSSQFIEFCRESEVNVLLLGDLRLMLLNLLVVVKDAEERANTRPSAAAWVDELHDVVFDAEDLFDEIITASAQRKAETKRQNFSISVRNILFSSSKKYRRVMDPKMKAICHRLEYFVRQRKVLRLSKSYRRLPFRRPTTSLVDTAFSVGRIDDKEKLMNMLLSDDGANGDNKGVVTIMGRGGVGKTTLAQLLYNDERVQKHFDRKAWVCLSEELDFTKVTKSVLESVTLRIYHSGDLGYLVAELSRRLWGRRFLIVLDNLNNHKNIPLLNSLKRELSFRNGENGSRIIITTRHRSVAEETHTFPIYKLEPLSDEDCWSLLAKHAFGGEYPSRYPNLEVIGKKIAKKCDGLPIAAKTLGSLLLSTVNLEEWEIILNNNITSGNLLQALRESYLHLPTHLKRCFVYCSTFPKGYLFDRKQLVLLWMAEGLVPEIKGRKAMEDIGDACLLELLKRSPILLADGRMFVMNALISDLTACVSRKSRLYFEGDQITRNVRHLSYHICEYDSSNKFSKS